MTTTTTAANPNPLKGLLAYGQSAWMDYIRRDLLTNGELQRMIHDDGLRGMTSNPAIFEKAIATSQDYADILNSREAKKLDAKGIFEKIAIRDVQAACDIFKPVYDESKTRDGYVSLEVSPELAADAAGTLEEARRLWKEVNRANVMIKIPATKECVPVIRQALEAGVKKGQDVSHIASVASFFVSRIDSLIDSKLEEMLEHETDTAKRSLIASVHGQVAIANAKLTYKKYQELFSGPRWKALADKGAQTQRRL